MLCLSPQLTGCAYTNVASLLAGLLALCMYSVSLHSVQGTAGPCTLPSIDLYAGAAQKCPGEYLEVRTDLWVGGWWVWVCLWTVCLVCRYAILVPCIVCGTVFFMCCCLSFLVFFSVPGVLQECHSPTHRLWPGGSYPPLSPLLVRTQGTPSGTVPNDQLVKLINQLMLVEKPILEKY
jgi:hypothetical protein